MEQVRPTLVESIAAASLAKLIGYSLVVGILASVPLVFAMRNSIDDRPPPSPEDARVTPSPEIPKIAMPRVNVPAPRVEANLEMSRIATGFFIGVLLQYVLFYCLRWLGLLSDVDRVLLCRYITMNENLPKYQEPL